MGDLAERVIGACIEVHRTLGPGLLESAYAQCLCRELALLNIPFVYQPTLPVKYKGMVLDCGYRVDLLIDNRLVVEIKAIDKILPVHEAQLQTYLRVGGWEVGLLINFNAKVLKDGITRRVQNRIEQ
jgi:GxxExxY protein